MLEEMSKSWIEQRRKIMNILINEKMKDSRNFCEDLTLLIVAST